MRRIEMGTAVAVCFVGLVGCNKPQPVGSEPARAAEKVTEPVNEPEENEARERRSTVPPSIARERLLASLTQHPEPFVALKSAGGLSPLRPLIGKPVALHLALP